MTQSDRPFALDVKDRNNLDAEMTALVEGIEKKYGYTPNFLKFYMIDNQRLRAFVTPYLELLRTDSGVSPFEHEMIALVSAATNGCVYCTTHHGMFLRQFKPHGPGHRSEATNRVFVGSSGTRR